MISEGFAFTGQPCLSSRNGFRLIFRQWRPTRFGTVNFIPFPENINIAGSNSDTKRV